MTKPIICIDFDGVIHSYERGWQGGEIYGTVTVGFFEWAKEVSKHFRLVVYSSRSKTPEGIRAMQRWMEEQTMRWLDPKGEGGDFAQPFPLEYAHEKPPAFLTIDDRCIRFTGDWKAFSLEIENLRTFRPWTQPDPTWQ